MVPVGSSSDPSDPVVSKDHPTRVPFPPKSPEGKDSNPNEVLEKPGEWAALSLSSVKELQLVSLLIIIQCSPLQF